jgi:hypothetical protein
VKEQGLNLEGQTSEQCPSSSRQHASGDDNEENKELEREYQKEKERKDCGMVCPKRGRFALVLALVGMWGE